MAIGIMMNSVLSGVASLRIPPSGHQCRGRFQERSIGIITALTSELYADVAETFADEIEHHNKQLALQHAVQVIVTMAVHPLLGSGHLFPSDQTELRAIVAKVAQGVFRLPPTKTIPGLR